MNLRRSSQARVGRLRNLNSHRRTGLSGLSRYVESLEDRLALSASPIQVTTTADVVDPNDGLTSLREAIEQANAAATPQTIVLPAGHYQLSAAAGELEISSSVTIAGADAMSTIVDGSGQVRVFHIDGSDMTVSFSGLTIQGGNASGNGGGILDTATVSHLLLTDCMVNGNAASGDGGAIDEAAGTSTLTLNGCTIANNTSGGNGGGIEIASTQTIGTLTNCTIYGNAATGHGGALADDATGGTIMLQNDTIDGNSAAAGGGVWQSQSTINVKNTIIAKNSLPAGGAGADVSGAFVPGGASNLIGDASGSTGFLFAFSATISEISDPTWRQFLTGDSAHSVDPQLGPLVDNGGPTLTQALLPSSLALNAGLADGAPVTDQRGAARPQGYAVDIGAFEKDAPPLAIVNALATLNTDGSLQLLLTGSGFNNIAGGPLPPGGMPTIVRVDGKDVAATVLSDTKIKAVVPASQLGSQSISIQAIVRYADTAAFSNVWKLDVPQSPTQPSTPEGKFVSAVYQDLLHRAPDAPGLTYWTGFLDHGGSRAQFVGALQSSPERLADQVQSLFQTYLHREADPGATTYFASFLAAGGSPDQIAVALTGSPEYFQAHGASADGFIDALFHDVLRRDPDPTSRTFFEQELAAGASPLQAAAQIFASDEYRRDEVNEIYVEFLGRQADPQALDHFAAALSHGLTEAQLIRQIAASDEFFSKATN